jgi:hypothetical protein
MLEVCKTAMEINIMSLACVLPDNIEMLKPIARIIFKQISIKVRFFKNMIVFIIAVIY